MQWLQTRDDILKHAKAHAATMKAGDAVIFDSRVLHAGTANLPKDQGAKALSLQL
jgi:ectoine hydroxylase-related dioxygenase (phytanoyl-CoA dioxygenase family)